MENFKCILTKKGSSYKKQENWQEYRSEDNLNKENNEEKMVEIEMPNGNKRKMPGKGAEKRLEMLKGRVKAFEEALK